MYEIASRHGRARSSLDTTSTGGGVCLFMHVGTGRRRLAASQSPLIVLGLLAHFRGRGILVVVVRLSDSTRSGRRLGTMTSR